MAAHMDILRHLVIKIPNTNPMPVLSVRTGEEDNACGGQFDRKPVAAGFWAGILFAAA